MLSVRSFSPSPLRSPPLPSPLRTGRSAAIFSEAYGSGTTQALSTATKPFLYSPAQQGLQTETPLVVQRGTLWVATKESEKTMHDLYNSSKAIIPSLQLVSKEEIERRNPWTFHPNVVGGVWEPDAADMDVNGIWMAVRKQAQKNVRLRVLFALKICWGGRDCIACSAGSPRAGTIALQVC